MPGSSIDTAHGLLSQGRDVMLVGDDGAGKTWMLEQIADQLRKRSVDTLVISARSAIAGEPLSPFWTTGISIPAADRVSPERIAALVREELPMRRGRLLVDDLDLLSAEAVALVRMILRESGARMVATAAQASAALSQTPPLPFIDLLAERAPAEVPVLPLPVDAMSRFIAARLPGRPDGDLVASLSAQSGSNPRVAEALLDIAVTAGVVGESDGLWSELGSIEDISAVPVVYALTGRLSAEEKRALEFIAWTGPLPPAEIEQLVDSDTLLALNQRGRLTWSPTEVGHEVRVSPPALARGLRSRLTPERRFQFLDTAQTTFGSDFVLDRDHAEIGGFPMVGFDQDDYWKWSAEFAALVRESAAVREAATWSTWAQRPSVENACGYLRKLAVPRPADTLRQIFEDTVFDDSDTFNGRLQFSLYELQWMIWSGQEAAIPAWLDSLTARIDNRAELVRATYAVMSIFKDGSPVTAEYIASYDRRGVGAYETNWWTLLYVSLLLEAGRPDDALEQIDARVESDQGSVVSTYLDYLRTEALLMLGRLDDAERWSRRCAEHAYDRLDSVGFQFHALGVARALMLRGRYDAAWRALSTGLRLGSGGPFAIPQPPLLLLGSVIQANRGDVDFARALLDEAMRVRAFHLPPHGSRAEIARAAILRAEGDVAEADAVLWKIGADAASLGHLVTACAHWADMTELTAAQSAAAAPVIAAIQSPLYEAVYTLSAAVTAGDADRIAQSLDAGGDLILPRVAVDAVDTIDRLREAQGEEPLDRNARIALIGERVPSDESSREREELSDREREVAILARAGLSNRDIAHRLFVSVRTIENHMYRLLKKLGYANRGELRDEWNPDL